jgi:aspartate/methionine/tyrosine aminotransferase
MFSRRVPGKLTPNSIARAAAAIPSDELIDLTLSNPTRAALPYPPDLLDGLRGRDGLTYRPEPFGLEAARVAAAGLMSRGGLQVDPARLVLTASTSEAYTILLKLLCDAGDEVLVPAPSYPLVEHLCRLESVAAVPYRLEYDGVWRIDFESLRAGGSGRTRAVITVSPNNPTGSITTRQELRAIGEWCAAHGSALIADEVFADYLVEPAPDAAATALLDAEALTFALGGLSKSAGLPQLKLGWMALAGPAADVSAALSRLEWICDTYLSVGTPIQLAAPRLLDATSGVRAAVAERVRENYAALRRARSRCPSADVLRVEGGWYAVVRVPSILSEEQLVLDLLGRDGVFVHPGFFFDFAREAYLIVSLLPPRDRFDAGIGRMFERLNGVV